MRRRGTIAVTAAIAAALVAAIAIGEPPSGDRSANGSGGARFVRSVEGDEAVIWAVGDGADGSDKGKAVAAHIASRRVDRLLYLGDVYEDGTAREFRRHYATTYGRLAGLTAPTTGNHDARNERRGYDRYWRGVHGRRPPDWYTFRAGGWRILALDSEAAHHRGSPQYRWLRRRLRAPGSCRIAFWHRPRFSAGTQHGDAEDMAPLWNALRGHAAIVIAGHEHDMQRFKPHQGITQFVSGAGGNGLYRLHRDHRLAFGDDRHYGALRLRLRRGAADHAFVAVDGRVLDRGTVRCRP